MNQPSLEKEGESGIFFNKFLKVRPLIGRQRTPEKNDEFVPARA
jgi:hypothetical protein